MWICGMLFISHKLWWLLLGLHDNLECNTIELCIKISVALCALRDIMSPATWGKCNAVPHKAVCSFVLWIELWSAWLFCVEYQCRGPNLFWGGCNKIQMAPQIVDYIWHPHSLLSGPLFSALCTARTQPRMVQFVQTHKLRKEPFWLFKKTQRKISKNTLWRANCVALQKSYWAMSLFKSHWSYVAM